MIHCCWCNKPIHIGIGHQPLTLCNDCYEHLDQLASLLGRYRPHDQPSRERLP